MYAGWVGTVYLHQDGGREKGPVVGCGGILGSGDTVLDWEVDSVKCIKCGSKHIEEFGLNPGDFHWWLCHDCGHNWPTKEEEDDAS